MPFNPFYLLAPPALILVSLPLTFFAGATTCIAFTLLFIRVGIVYLELGVSIARALLFPEAHKAPVKPSTPRLSTPEEVKLRRRRSSLWSQASSANGQDIQPKKVLHRTESFASLLGAGAGNRDYEGVGGWRDVEDDRDESTWLSMNARLQLPVERQTNTRRHHHRSFTAGSGRMTMSPEVYRMSPVQSRARTPSIHSLADNGLNSRGEEEYFGLQPHDRAMPEMTPGNITALMRRKSLGDDRMKGMHSSGILRRKSTGEGSNHSSSSSSSSGRSSRVTIKQTAYG